MIDVDNTQTTDYHNDQEPDMKSYMDTKSYMESEQYAIEFDKAFGKTMTQIDDLIDGLLCIVEGES
ncbi:MAG: hypothetical protein ABGY11_04405 [Candidatus Thioglobus sp.]|jgi:hypothetical protein